MKKPCLNLFTYVFISHNLIKTYQRIFVHHVEENRFLKALSMAYLITELHKKKIDAGEFQTCE